MNWLLPASTLLKMIGSGNTPVQVWANGVDTRSLRTTAISVAQARVSIQAAPNPAIRVRLESDLDTVLAQIEADSGIAPLAFTTEHAKLWEHLCLDPSIASVKQVDRQVYATAMYEGFTVAEPGRSEHSALTAIGVRIHAF